MKERYPRPVTCQAPINHTQEEVLILSMKELRNRQTNLDTVEYGCKAELTKKNPEPMA